MAEETSNAGFRHVLVQLEVRDFCYWSSASRLDELGGEMGFLAGTDPVVCVSVAVGVGSAARLVALAIALRGAAPSERPAIIRAMADLFRVRIGRRR